MSPLEIHMDALNGNYRCPLEWYIQKNIFLIININESKIVAKLFFFKMKNQSKDEKNRDKNNLYLFCHYSIWTKTMWLGDRVVKILFFKCNVHMTTLEWYLKKFHLPEENIAIAKGMIGWFGNLLFHVYMPRKLGTKKFQRHTD